MSRTTIMTAGVLATALAVSATGAALAQDGEPADPVTNPFTGEVSDTLVPQASGYDTYVEHIRALNDCDWMGLMAQYPNNAEIHLTGAVFTGRQAIGDLFAGFVQEFPAGNCGMVFTEETRLQVGNTENVQWVAEADFLAEPHRNSDAYVSDGQYMVVQVTTFGSPPLVYTEEAQAALDALAAEAGAAEEMAEGDAVEDEMMDEADLSEEEAAALEEMDDDEEAIAEELMEDEEE